MEVLGKNFYDKNKIVTLIDQNGVVLGEKTYLQAYLFAKELNKDLFIAREDEKPFLKIFDYGKYLYKQKKNQKNQKKNEITTKEIKFGLGIGKNDYNLKICHIKQFLEKGNFVKVTLQLNGREVERIETATLFMESVIEDISECGITEDDIKLNGKSISLMFKRSK